MCVHEDVSSVCLGTVPLCNPCLLSLWSGKYLYVFAITPEWLGKQTAHLLMSSSVEYARCIHEREGGRERKGRGRESKVNLSKSLLYGVQTESALHNGLINGTMSRSGRAIIADDFALWGYLWRSGIAIQQMIWTLGAYQCGSVAGADWA